MSTTDKITLVKFFEIRGYTIKELANMYKISTRQINKWLSPHSNEIGERSGHSYTPGQVKKIIEMIGLPPGYKIP